MKNPFQIRRFEATDAEEVQNVARSSWHFTYKDIYSTEEIDQRVDKWYNISGLKSIVEYMDQGLTELVVMENTSIGQIVGFSQIGFRKYWEYEQVPDQPIWLTRIYLHPNVIGNGLGRKLLHRAEQFVRNHNLSSYMVEVHRDNIIGKNFYLKIEFEPVGQNDDSIHLRRTLD